MTRRRKTLAVLATLALGLTLGASASAQYPERPIRIVWPFGAGGTGEALGRIMAAGLSEQLKQSVIVESKPGAGGIVGFLAVKNAQPDGYTLLLGTIAPLTLAPSLRRNLPYDPIKDYEPIGMAFSSPYLIVVNPDKMPVKTLSELNARIKAGGASVNYASSGNGATQHVLNAAYNVMIDGKMTHVPYKGNAEALVSLMAGHTHMMFASTDALPHIAAGKARAIAVTGPRRLQAAPDIPTTAQAGMPELTLESWYGLMAPAGTPKPILERLSQALTAALASPKVHEQVQRLSTNVVPDTSTAHFRNHIVNETRKWKPLVEATGIKVD